MNTRGLGVLRHLFGRSAARFLVAALTAAFTALGLAGVVVAPAHSAQAGTTLTSTRTTSMAPGTYATRVQRLVNKQRVARGLPRLRIATCPDGTATDWSAHLASTDSFYHQDMGSLLDRCDARYAGETLGRGSMGPRKLVRMWMASPAHRAVLLSSKPRRIGVGATPDSGGRWVVAANFVRF